MVGRGGRGGRGGVLEMEEVGFGGVENIGGWVESEEG